MGKLIRLELFNFKSYKGHHSLVFGNSYFTSIIGPNGSGKSNSMDAISFVLGIKSSHLRSSNLRDLVYRGRVLKTSKINADGTATEAPTDGAVNGNANGDAGSDDEPSQHGSQRNDPQTAWVMAVFEDDAGDEQKWKRSITSQGQSEYRINNRVVNAKQYNEALEAENILIKARNFLVFQGDVEAIASQSPKDLTRLVEQISGSLEYKADYERLEEESAKAAEDQTFKLNQRRAINAEIKQYTEQKKEADNYNQKLEERDEAVVTHILWKLYHFQRVIEDSGAEIRKHQDELKEHRRRVENFEQHLDQAKKEQAKVGKEVTKVERSIRSAEKDIETNQNNLVPIDEKIDVSNKNLEKYRKRIADVVKERDAQAKAVEQIQKDLSTVQKAQSKWEAEWSKLAQKEGRQLNDADLKEYDRLKTEVNKRTATAQIKLDNLTRQRNTDEETVNSLKSKLDEYEKQLQKLENDVKDLKERRDNTNSQIEDTTKGINGKKKELSNVTSERLRAAQKHTELEEKLQGVLQKLVEADDGRRQSEKEVRAKETITAMKRIFPGVRGRVHELCKPKQKKYETAVSTVLGRHFDAIVVDSEKTAKDCISYLREQRAGQATFIPLDTIQVKSVSSNLKGMHKSMRLAIDTIEYEHAYDRAISYACGNAMVCDDLDTAKYLCYQKNVDAKAVTLDGTVIHKGGLMTGGRGPNDRNARRWEDSEVDNLHRVREKLMKELDALPKSHKSVTDEEGLQSELSGMEQALRFAKEESKALDKNLADKKKELSFLQGQIKETKPKHQKRSQDLASLVQQIDQSRAEISQVEDEVYASFCKRLGYENVRDYDAQRGNLQQEAAQKKLEFATQRSKLEHQQTFETQRLETTKNRIKSIEDQSKRDSDMISSLEAEKAELQEEIDQQTQHLDELRESLEVQRGKQSEKGERVAEQRRELQKQNKDVEFVVKTISGLEAEVQRTAASRYAQLRKCKIDEVQLPLVVGSASLDSLPVDDMLQAQADPDAMDVDQDEDAAESEMPAVQDYGIQIDFDEMEDDLKEDDSSTQEAALQSAITALTNELSNLSPNMRAIERLNTATERLHATTAEFDAARETARVTRETFEDVRAQRAELFQLAFDHISKQIGPVYKALTRSANFPLGGSAYLDTMATDDDAPFLEGLKYHAMPPLKRFRDMDALSGGEKTIAALALLFAVHSFQPSPFFVLDEVDAALDNANVAKVAKYIKEHAGPGMQFIVISLKTGLFQESECLVGVMRDQGANSSRAVTLDLRKYQANA